MRRMVIINQKGGVGKTTTAVNVGVALARAGHRVLLIDLDPQAHLTLHLGQDPASGRPGIYEMLTGSATVAKARGKVASKLWLVRSGIDLAGAEVELVSVVGREVILRDLLDQHLGAGRNPGRAPYDYVLMDCPPSLGVLTLNGLCAAAEVLIPLQPHYLALQGLGKLLETIALVSKRINPSLRVTGVAVCMNDAGTRLASEVIEDVRSFFAAARNTGVPWAETRLFETVIRRNIKLAEAPSYGQSIFDYAPDSHGAKDYEQLALEIHDPAEFRARASAAAAPGRAGSADQPEAAKGQEKEEPVEGAKPAASAGPGAQAQTTVEHALAETDRSSGQLDPALIEPIRPEPLTSAPRSCQPGSRAASTRKRQGQRSNDKSEKGKPKGRPEPAGKSAPAPAAPAVSGARSPTDSAVRGTA